MHEPAQRLAILGGGGDLAARLLLPALARLIAAQRLSSDLRLLAVDREDTDTAAFRERVRATLARRADDVDAAARDALIDRLEYRTADVTDGDALGRALAPVDEPLIAYLALPPRLFAPAIDALPAAAARIVVEKPFGEGVESARRLNAKLAAVAPERAIFRVDHFLAKQTVQNVLGIRFANRIFEPLWNRHHVSGVDIRWDETLTVEGRAGYYDSAGALRDMLQNHLLQLLSLIAMEPPAALTERDLRDRKVDVLRSIRTPTVADARERTLRARYVAGRIGDRDVPSYVDEPGVDAARNTETFAAVTLAIDNWRWAGVPFTLRSGKALARDRHEIAIRFQPVPHLAFGQDQDPRPNVLRLQLDPDVMHLESVVNGAGDPFVLEEATFKVELAPQDVPAYGRVLLDVIDGDPTFSIRGDEAEESWRIMEPILDAWAADETPLHDYPAGAQLEGEAGARWASSGAVH
jgi:glucose-6-phosphate 1-dehydrogenase